MITKINLDKYKSDKIKSSFDTEIRELSTDGNYNYIPGPVLTSLYPNGGENIWVKDFLVIKWNKEQDNLMPEVNINLILNDTNNIAIVRGTPNNGSYIWRVPLNLRSEKCKIKVFGTYDKKEYEIVSENYFIIDKRYIEVDDNNIKEITANVGDIYNLKWVHNGEGNNYRIELFNSKNNSLNKIIENNYFIKDGDPLIYDWEIMDIEPYIISTCKIKITNVAKPDIFGYTKSVILKVPFIHGLDVMFHIFKPTIILDDNFTTEYQTGILDSSALKSRVKIPYIQFTPETKIVNTDSWIVLDRFYMAQYDEYPSQYDPLPIPFNLFQVPFEIYNVPAQIIEGKDAIPVVNIDVNNTEIYENEHVTVFWSIRSYYDYEMEFTGYPPIHDVDDTGTYIVDDFEKAILPISGSKNISDDEYNIRYLGQKNVILNNEGTYKWKLTATNEYETVSSETGVVTVLKKPTISYPYPSILYFTANSEKIKNGKKVILSWKVEDAVKVTLQTIEDIYGSGSSMTDVIIDVNNIGTMIVTPTITTQYRIFAYNAANKIMSKHLVVDVLEKVIVKNLPVIKEFALIPLKINIGDSSLLTWMVEKSDSISISYESYSISKTYVDISTDLYNAEGILEGIFVDTSGNYGVSPEEDTTYTITAMNNDGTVTKDIKLEVNREVENPSKIKYFVSNKTEINDDESIILSWNVADATSVTLNGVEQKELKGNIEIWPIITDGTIQQINEYTLVTKNGIYDKGDISRIDVITNGLLGDNNFSLKLYSDADTISKNDVARLTWTSKGAGTVEIDNGIGFVDLNGSIEVSIIRDTVYTATAKSDDGELVKASSVNLKLIPRNVIPIIPSGTISVSSLSIKRGESVRITWTSKKAVYVIIDGLGNELLLNGTALLKPDFTTDYTLIATSKSGHRYIQIVNVEVDSVLGNIGYDIVPLLDVSINLNEINKGEYGIISWATLNGSKLTITDDLGNNLKIYTDLDTEELIFLENTPDTYKSVITSIENGSVRVQPNADSIYTIIVESQSGHINTHIININVNSYDVDIIPTINFFADSYKIEKGEVTRIKWNTENTETVNIDKIGDVSVDGAQLIKPEIDTTYKLTATSSTGNIETSEIFIEVYFDDYKLLPEIEFKIDPLEIDNGGIAYLIWDVKNAKNVSIDNSIGLVDVRGRYAVKPTVNTAYKMTVTTFSNTEEYRYAHIVIKDIETPNPKIDLTQE